MAVTKADTRQAKELLFVDAYLSNGGNGAEAYRVAGYRAKNANVAAVEAHKMLHRPSVVEMIETRRAETLNASKAGSDETLQSATRAIRFDVRKLFKPDGTMKPVAEWDPDTADAIAGIETVEAVVGDGEAAVKVLTRKLKWLDKNTAREQLMKHHGLYEVDNRQKAPRTVNIGQLTVGMNFEKVRARARLIEQV